MMYRREVDGLRALAVMPVILYHAGFSLFPGGFLGVDIFFVISGYLITRLILEEKRAGTFSIVKFYARRARRILPALYTMMLIVTPIAFFVMLPAQYEGFSRSVMAVLLFLSNLFFWRESGYFGPTAAEQPLLHTWSLGVEEQFYVFFPLAILLLWKGGTRLILTALVLTVIASLFLSEYASRYFVSANFFLLPMRAWELLIGSVCAWLHVSHTIKGNQLLSGMGLLAILLAVLGFNNEMRLPSLYALLPVGGAALVLLYASAETLAARILSMRLVVGIGLISYSAYLWHHPLFALTQLYFLGLPGPWAMAGLVLVSFGLAALSWRYVEQPFRHKTHPHFIKNTQALRLGMCAAAGLVAISISGYLTGGFLEYWKRHTPPDQARAFTLIEEARQKQQSHSYDNGACVFRVNAISEAVQKRIVQCYQEHGSGIAVLGDSHAINLFFLLMHSAKDTPFYIGFVQGMCRPHDDRAECMYGDLLKFLGRQKSLFSNVIYTQSALYLYQGMKDDDITYISMNAAVPQGVPDADRIQKVLAYLTRLSQYARVTWVGLRIEPQLRMDQVIRRGCRYPFALRPQQAEYFTQLDAALAQAAAATPVHYFSQIAALKFDIAKDFINCDAVYWTDENHLSEAGERYFSSRITLSKVLGK